MQLQGAVALQRRSRRVFAGVEAVVGEARGFDGLCVPAARHKEMRWPWPALISHFRFPVPN